MELMIITRKSKDTIPTVDSPELSLSHTKSLARLEQRMRSVHQSLTPRGPQFSVADNESSVLDNAELYRTAAQISLGREEQDAPPKSSI